MGKVDVSLRVSTGEHRSTVLDVCGNGFPTSARSEAFNPTVLSKERT